MWLISVSVQRAACINCLAPSEHVDARDNVVTAACAAADVQGIDDVNNALLFACQGSKTHKHVPVQRRRARPSSTGGNVATTAAAAASSVGTQLSPNDLDPGFSEAFNLVSRPTSNKKIWCVASQQTLGKHVTSWHVFPLRSCNRGCTLGLIRPNSLPGPISCM
jgi:hypothetical protein